MSLFFLAERTQHISDENVTEPKSKHSFEHWHGKNSSDSQPSSLIA